MSVDIANNFPDYPFALQRFLTMDDSGEAASSETPQSAKRKLTDDDVDDSVSHTPSSKSSRISGLSRGFRRLPKNVSQWKIDDAARINIKYDDDYTIDPLDLLQRVSKLADLSENFKKNKDAIKSFLDFDAVFSSKLLTKPEQLDDRKCIYTNHFKQIFRKMLDTIYKPMAVRKSGGGDCKEDEMPCSTEGISDIYKQALVEFIHAMDNVMKKEEIVFKSTRNSYCVPEEAYITLLSCFARLCGLLPMAGRNEKSILRLLGHDIVSVPDLRLYRPEELTSSAHLVVIVEVKHGSIPGRSLEGSSSPTSQIETELSSNVLGQHAGELLLDYRQFNINQKMLGMIVYETKVFFTLLDMSFDHFWKIFENEQGKLDGAQDIAVIYYSKPLDIKIKEERDKLIECFARINCMQ